MKSQASTPCAGFATARAPVRGNPRSQSRRHQPPAQGSLRRGAPGRGRPPVGRRHQPPAQGSLLRHKVNWTTNNPSRRHQPPAQGSLHAWGCPVCMALPGLHGAPPSSQASTPCAGFATGKPPPPCEEYHASQASTPCAGFATSVTATNLVAEGQVAGINPLRRVRYRRHCPSRSPGEGVAGINPLRRVRYRIRRLERIALRSGRRHQPPAQGSLPGSGRQ